MEKPSTAGGTRCAALGCFNSRGQQPALSFFRFPKDKERCKCWVINCKRADYGEVDASYLYEIAKLCAEHFEDSQFMNSTLKNKLIWSAVPTVFPAAPKPPPRLLHPMRATPKDFYANCRIRNYAENPPGKDMMEPSFEFVEVKDEPTEGQVSSTMRQASAVDRVSDHSEDVLSQCDEIIMKEEDVCIKDEPIEDLDVFTRCTSFAPAMKSKPRSNNNQPEESCPAEVDVDCSTLLGPPYLEALPTSLTLQEERRLELALLQAKIDCLVAQKWAYEADAEYIALLSQRLEGDNA